MNKKNDLYDVFLDKIKFSSITSSLILLMLFWGVIPAITLKLLHIDVIILPEVFKILYTLFFDILFLILIIFLYRKDIKKEIKTFFNKKNIITNVSTSLTYWFIGLIVMIICNFIIAIFTPNLATNEVAVRSMIDKFPLYMAFQVMIYAPITEEIIFRKSIDRIFKNKYLYILASGLVFGGLHVISSVTSPIDLLYLLPYCSLGCVFALLYKNTNNIFSTITAHAIHNTLAFTLYIFSPL